MTTPVSGPGPFSQRTDRQPAVDIPNADYGEQQAFQALQSGAPMAADSGQAPPLQGGGPDLSSIIGLDQGTQRPDEDIMSGVQPQGPDYSAQDMANRQAWLPVLSFMADQQGASWALRNVVRKLQAGSGAVSS